MSSYSISEILTVVTNIIARDFNTTSATPTEHLNKSKAFKGFGQAGLCHKIYSVREFRAKISPLFFHFSSYTCSCNFGWEILAEDTVDASVPWGSILGATIFMVYIEDLPDDVIINVAIYVNDSTPNSTSEWVFPL